MPFRPRKSPFLHFGRNHKNVKKEEEKTEAPAAAVHLEEEEGEESEAGTTVTEKPEETSTRVFKPVRMGTTTMIRAKNLIKSERSQVTRKGPRVKSNLLFNRRKPGGISSGRNKFAGKIPGILSTPAAETTSTTESVTDKGEDVATTMVATTEEEEAEGEKRPNIASRFKSSNRRPFGGVRPGKHPFEILFNPIIQDMDSRDLLFLSQMHCWQKGNCEEGRRRRSPRRSRRRRRLRMK